jgi:hypothetical protein
MRTLGKGVHAYCTCVYLVCQTICGVESNNMLGDELSCNAHFQTYCFKKNNVEFDRMD